MGTNADNRCPDRATLEKFLEDALPQKALDRIDSHVSSCADCQQALEFLVGIERHLPTRESGEELPPELAGFTTLDRIAAGGMGVVWRVFDHHIERRLAIKVMKHVAARQASLVQRFHQEARLCAQLAHPFIVPIHHLDVLPDGRPYYSMKLVEGETLASRLQRRETLAQDRMQLVQIFGRVCQAVAFAHRQAIIHRDLKPQNIMLGEHGEVQLMDWGLAKQLPKDASMLADTKDIRGQATISNAAQPSGADTRTTAAGGQGRADFATQFGDILGTFAYMPPEQANGQIDEVDRQSDVFGLGAILCEILTGVPPYVGPNPVSIRLQATAGQTNDAWARLSVCGADSELVEIARRCLAPVRSDRPTDAGGVASAVGRYVLGVQERLEQERLARERQEVRAVAERRRRRLLAIAALSVLVTLALGVVVSTVFAMAERRQSQASEEYANFITDVMLAPVDPRYTPNRNITLREVVDLAVEKLRHGYFETPEINCRLRLTLGSTYSYLGDYSLCRELFEEALQIGREELGETHPQTMKAMDQLGQTLVRYVEDFNRAEQLLREAHRLQAAALSPEHEDTIHTYAKLGDLYWKMGRLDEAMEITNSVLETRRRRFGDTYEFRWVSLNGLGRIYRDLGQPEVALKYFEQAEEGATQYLGPDHPSTLRYRQYRAMALADLERWAEAEELANECLAEMRGTHGENHFWTLHVELTLADISYGTGAYEDARIRAESILQRLGATVPEDHSFRALVLLTLGRCYTAEGDYSQAELALLRSQQILLLKVGPDHISSRAVAKALDVLASHENSDPGSSR